MISPATLQDAIVSKLQAIPELVDFVGDAAEIQAFDDESVISGNADLAEMSMMGRGILVVWDGVALPRIGESRGWTHTFRLHLKAENIQAYHTLANLIIDGHPDGEYDNFLNCNISDLTDGLQNVNIVSTRGDHSVARLLIEFTLTEKQ